MLNFATTRIRVIGICPCVFEQPILREVLSFHVRGLPSTFSEGQQVLPSKKKRKKERDTIGVTSLISLGFDALGLQRWVSRFEHDHVATNNSPPSQHILVQE